MLESEEYAAGVDSSSPEPNAAIGRTSAEWFATEVHPHESSLKAYLRGSFPAVRDVDDLVHESYVRLLKQKAVQPVLSAKALLFTVAKHLALDRLRRARRSPVQAVANLAAIEIQDEQRPIAGTVSRAEKIRLLTEAIDALPAKCREVVVLRKLQLLSQKETAERLGISEKGVENQLARGIERCRAFLYDRGVKEFFDDER